MSKKSKQKIETLYEDEDILAVFKPPNVLSIPDRYDKSVFNLYDCLNQKYGKIYQVHRLDKETSGVIVFGKNPEAHKNLNEQFQEREAKRIYRAVVTGRLLRDELEVDIPLATHSGKKDLVVPSARGKPSFTRIKSLEKFSMADLVECELITGRRHQIRVHCSAVGYPLLVDSIYGESEGFYLSSIKKRYNLKKGKVERPIISRLTLHAYLLEIRHPKTNQFISIKADYPKDFAALLQILRKYAAPSDFIS